ncbi:MAG: M20/M25/M40 family metallo-hydrolase [Elusimicrobiota bacterium]
MNVLRYAGLLAAGLLVVYPLNAEEIPFDDGVRVAPILQSARQEAGRAPQSTLKTSPSVEIVPDMSWVAMEDADADAVRQEIDLSRREVLQQKNGITLIQVAEVELLHLADIMHRRRNRCGGFFTYSSKDEALRELAAPRVKVPVRMYSLGQPAAVAPMVDRVSEASLRQVISSLAGFNNRYYKSKDGVASAEWISSQWKDLAKGRDDIDVEFYRHDWPQSSVILTVRGTKEPGKILIMGGHADSIAGYWGGETARAPGADDNASGIAVLTEALRVIVESGFRPERTIKLIAYAAEEVGLRGSKDIAADFAARGVDVVGAVQFDMTLYKGSSKALYFITDNTSAALNSHLGKLVDRYVKVEWGTTECGYGCSDHASWNSKGYPAAFPFEAEKNGANGNIHSARDTLASAGGTAGHAVPFAKLAVAYVVTTSKAGSSQLAHAR